MAESAPAKRRHVFTWILLGIVLATIAIVWIRSAIVPPVQVRTAIAGKQDLTATTSTNGVVEPVSDYQFYSPGATTVTRVLVTEGQQVQRGVLMVTLDDADAVSTLARAQSQVKSAQADLSSVRQGGTTEERLLLGGQISSARAVRDQAQRELDTLKKLQSGGAASQAEVDAAQNRLNSANSALALDQSRQTGRYAVADIEKSKAAMADAAAQYQAAQSTVAKSNLRAPVEGTVYSLPVHATEFVQAGEKILAMADLSHVRVRAYYDEPEIGHLAVGQPATFIWAAKPNRVWHGKVAQLPSTIIHYGTRNVGEVLLAVDETDSSLLPATNVTVTVTNYARADVLTVPREAIHLDARGTFVFVVERGRLRRKDVEQGAYNTTTSEIVSGLQSGDTVVLGSDSGVTLAPGMKVRTGG